MVLLSWLMLAQANDYQEQLSSADQIVYSVNVVGAVKNPGIYMVPPSARVSMVIKLANTITDTLNTAQQVIENPSSRDIVLRRKGQQNSLDMERYWVLGDLEQNPFVKDGDVIIIPTAKNFVYLSGAVGLQTKQNQLKMEILPGERISDLLDLTFGLANGIDDENCELVRFDTASGGIESKYFSARAVMQNPDSEQNYQLQAGDRLYIRQVPDFQVKRYITIQGEVKYPGEYAIDLGKTTLSEILKKSGGPTEMADLKKSYLLRLSQEDVTHSEYEYLRRFPSADLSTREYRYLRQMIAESRNIISEDFSELYAGNAPEKDVILKDKDRIFISTKATVISVNGEVATPGLYGFVEGMDYQYYIEQAGGTLKKANSTKIRIIRDGSGEWIKPDKHTKLYAGDTIYVPRYERFSYYWPYIKETVSFVTGLATSVVVIQGLLGN
jgi:protein involved in polysaccharide export with SLBB domain